MNEVWLRVNKGGLFKAKSMNEVDAGRDRGSSEVKTVNEEEEEDQ